MSTLLPIDHHGYTGSKLLPEMLDYITSALQSTYLEVRRLGSKYAAQLAREASVDAAAGQRFGALLKGLEVGLEELMLV